MHFFAENPRTRKISENAKKPGKGCFRSEVQPTVVKIVQQAETNNWNLTAVNSWWPSALRSAPAQSFHPDVHGSKSGLSMAGFTKVGFVRVTPGDRNPKKIIDQFL